MHVFHINILFRIYEESIKTEPDLPILPILLQSCVLLHVSVTTGDQVFPWKEREGIVSGVKRFGGHQLIVFYTLQTKQVEITSLQPGYNQFWLAVVDCDYVISLCPLGKFPTFSFGQWRATSLYTETQ